MSSLCTHCLPIYRIYKLNPKSSLLPHVSIWNVHCTVCVLVFVLTGFDLSLSFSWLSCAQNEEKRQCSEFFLSTESISNLPYKQMRGMCYNVVALGRIFLEYSQVMTDCIIVMLYVIGPSPHIQYIPLLWLLPVYTLCSLLFHMACCIQFTNVTEDWLTFDNREVSLHLV